MKISRSISTGSYTEKLTDRVSKIKKNAKKNRKRRIVLFIVMILIAAAGILYGISSKAAMLEKQYRLFTEMPERSKLSPELLTYKDTYDLFVQECLGNTPSQSMMGGHFYDKGSFMIYPDKTAARTLISISGQEHEMAGFLIDEINVRGDHVVFRNPSSRELYLYNTVSCSCSPLSISDAGQLVVCGDEFFYIDLSRSSLIQFNSTTNEKKTLVRQGVLSFVVAGNDLLILDSSHTLRMLDLTKNTTTVIGKNINAFTFDGYLWIQNNTSVYRKKLDDKSFELIELGLQCNRLLGVTESGLIFESRDGVYLFNLTGSVAFKIGTGLFEGASNDKILWFNQKDNTYRVEKLSLIKQRND